MKACFKNSSLFVFLKVVVETSFSRCSPVFNTGSILFLVCIKDLANEFKPSGKLLADDTSLTIVNNKNDSANIVSNDQLLIFKWVCNWNMLFNPDPSNPAQEVLF